LWAKELIDVPVSPFCQEKAWSACRILKTALPCERGSGVDRSGDGALSAEEFRPAFGGGRGRREGGRGDAGMGGAGAVRSLARLDRNGDGQLTMEEIAPPFGRVGTGRRPEYRRPESR